MNKKIVALILFLLCGITILDLFHPGLPITHDGQDHIARIANFYKNLQEGVIIPRWAANLNWGYGHPIIEFLYPLPSYIASVFHSLGFPFIDSTKIVFAIGMVFSGVGMCLWLSEFLPLSGAFTGGMLYVFAPYRFVEVYVRGDIGENLAFVFMPFVLWSIYNLYKTQKGMYVVTGSLSLAFLILSHNAISLMYLPFILFYCIYLILKTVDKKSLILNSCFLILLGLGLSAFFWIPGLLEGKFTLRNIVTAGEYKTRFVTFQSLLYGPWSYGITGQFTTQLGIVHWIMLLLSFPVTASLWKRKDKNYSLLVGLLIYTAIAIVLMLPLSNLVWQKVPLLQNFQFPWRFLAVTVFATAVLGAFVISKTPKHFQMMSVVIFSIAILFFTKDYWHAKGYLYKPDGFFSGIYDATTDTGESAPIWSVRFMEHRYKTPLEVIGGYVKDNKQLTRTATKHVYTVTVMQKAQFLENTLYFPGWQVLIDNKKTAVEYQDGHHRGLMTFFVDKGKHTIEVVYRETKLRIIADTISIISFLVIVYILGIRLKTKP